MADPLMRGKTLGFELDLMRKFQPTCREAERRTRIMLVRDMNSINLSFFVTLAKKRTRQALR